MSTQYWPVTGLDGKPVASIELDLVSELALELVHIYGAIAGREGGKVDDAGRQTFQLQPPIELVIRCFDIAEAFYNEAAARGGIRRADISQRVNDIMRLKTMIDEK